MAIKALDKDEISAELEQLHDDWQIKEQRLCRKFIFKDFIQAFSFMSASALYCEKHNHHPEWTNMYKTVTVGLITHQVNSITSKDIALAITMDEIASNFLHN